MSSGEVVKTREVPTKWYIRYEATKKAAQRLSENLKQRGNSSGLPEGITSVGYTRDEQLFGGTPGLQLRVGVNKEEGFNSRIPDHFENIPVQVETELEKTESDCKEDCGEEYTFHENGVPAGVAIRAVSSDDAGKVASSGNVTYYGDWSNYGDEFLLTCAHGFLDSPHYDACGETFSGDVYQPNKIHGDWIGKAEIYDVTDDWALIGKNSIDYRTNIYNGSFNYYLAGTVSQSNAAWMASNGYTCYQMGAGTCETQGEVIAIEESVDRDACSTSDWIRTTCPHDDGDSGGPTYTKHTDGEAYLLNILSVGVSCYDSDRYGRGVAGYKLNNQYDIYIG